MLQYTHPAPPWSWYGLFRHRRKVSDDSHVHDIYGNRVLHMSSLTGLTSAIRYTKDQQIPYFSMSDAVAPFLVKHEMSIETVWGELDPEVKDTISPRALQHVFRDDSIDTPSLTLCYNDILKFILHLPIPYAERSDALDTFVVYYRTHFKSSKNGTEVRRRSSGSHYHLCDFHYQATLISSFVLGVVFSFVLFAATNLCDNM